MECTKESNTGESCCEICLYQDHRHGRQIGGSKIRNTEREAPAVIPTRSKDCVKRELTEWIQQGRGILGILRKCFPDYVVVGWVDRKSERGISNDPQMFYVNPLGRWWSYSLGEKIQEENQDGGEKKINSI